MKREQFDNVGIYAIMHEGRVIYIGQSVNIDQRYRQHLGALKKGWHENQRLQDYANKLGCDNLVFRVIMYCSISEVLYYEQFFINVFRPITNIAGSKGWDSPDTAYFDYEALFKAIKKIYQGKKIRVISTDEAAKRISRHLGAEVSPKRICMCLVRQGYTRVKKDGIRMCVKIS